METRGDIPGRLRSPWEAIFRDSEDSDLRDGLLWVDLNLNRFISQYSPVTTISVCSVDRHRIVKGRPG